MRTRKLTESIIEQAALDWLQAMGREPFFDPEIAPGMQAGVPDAERIVGRVM